MSRTLPREIIRWIQSLDLSYSYRDSKRDLNNGFLIAEIFTRYFPHGISMHSFDNSENTVRKNNNWYLLNKFFLKNEVPFEPHEYNRIKEGDFEQLVAFMLKLYTYLTKRTVAPNPYGVAKETLLPETDGKTETYLLTNKGMEKLDVSKEIHNSSHEVPVAQVDSPSRGGKNQFSAGTAFRETQFRENATRDGRNSHKSYALSGMDSNLDGKVEGADAQENVNGIVDLLNETIREAYEDNPQTEEEQVQLEEDREKLEGIDFENDIMAYHHFAERIDLISDDFVKEIFNNLGSEKMNLVPLLVRSIGNDLWRFMEFFFTALAHISVHREGYIVIHQTLTEFTEEILKKEKIRLTFFFKDLFISKFIETVKTAEHPQKREDIIQLLYSFFPAQEPSARHEAIRIFKERLNNDMALFIQSLGVLITYEHELKAREEEAIRKRDQEDIKKREETNNKDLAETPLKAEEKWDTEATRNLLRDFKFYAKYAIKDKNSIVRVHGLVLMHRLIFLDYDWVQKVMVRYFDCVSPLDTWENRIMIVTVYCTLLKRLSETELYQKHIKSRNPDMNKLVSVENEMLVKIMKEVFEQISLTIAHVLSRNLKPDITRVSLVYLSEVMAESPILVDTFLNLLLQADPNLRGWVLYNGLEDEGDEFYERYLIEKKTSVSHRVCLNSDALQALCPEMLEGVNKKVKAIEKSLQEPETSKKRLAPQDIFGQNYLDILVYCFEHTDFQKLNVEVFDSLINNSLPFVINGMLREETCEKSSQILERFIENYLREEVLIQELEKRLGQMIIVALTDSSIAEEDELKTIKSNLWLFIEQLRAEYTPEKAIFEKFCKMMNKLSQEANSRNIPGPDGQLLDQKLGMTDLEGGDVSQLRELEEDEDESKNE